MGFGYKKQKHKQGKKGKLTSKQKRQLKKAEKNNQRNDAIILCPSFSGKLLAKPSQLQSFLKKSREVIPQEKVEGTSIPIALSYNPEEENKIRVQLKQGACTSKKDFISLDIQFLGESFKKHDNNPAKLGRKDERIRVTLIEGVAPKFVRLNIELENYNANEHQEMNISTDHHRYLDHGKTEIIPLAQCKNTDHYAKYLKLSLIATGDKEDYIHVIIEENNENKSCTATRKLKYQLLFGQCAKCNENDLRNLYLDVKPLQWICSAHLSSVTNVYIDLKQLTFHCIEHKAVFGFKGLHCTHADNPSQYHNTYLDYIKIITNWILENDFSFKDTIATIPKSIQKKLDHRPSTFKEVEVNSSNSQNNSQDKQKKEPISKEIPSKNTIHFDEEGYTYSKKGLKNFGNTCFLNSVLQCLAQSESLARFYLELPQTTADDEHIFPQIGPMNNALTQFFRFMYSKPAEAFCPKWILNQVGVVARHLKCGAQQDAHELLRYLQMIASSEFTNSSDNIIDNTFLMKLRTTVICQNCRNISKHTSDNIDLSVPVLQKRQNKTFIELSHQSYLREVEVQREFPNDILDPQNILNSVSDLPPDQLHLLHCLWGYFKVDHLSNEKKDGYLCEKCSIQKSQDKEEKTIKTLRPAYLQYSLEIPPQVLTIQLKRFNLDNLKSKHSISKLEQKVMYPEELDIRPFFHEDSEYLQAGRSTKYRLFGVVSHLGSTLNSGHYVSCTRQLRMNSEEALRGEHVFQSDASVKGCSEKEMLNQQGYLLFYEMI